MIKRNKIFILLLFIVVITTSCEKVIDVNLNDSIPRLVVEANISNIVGLNYVNLTKSANYFNSEDIVRVKGAEVVLIDDLGNRILFDEVEDGFYSKPTFGALPNSKYKLQVKADGYFIESISTTPSVVEIDSLVIESTQFGRPPKDGNHQDNIYKILCYFTDPVDEENFYKFRLIINGFYLDGFYILDDKLYNGKVVPYQFNGFSLNEGDEIRVEIVGIDKNNYDYFFTLSNIIGAGQDITPGNPPTNLEGDAIGIFSVNTFDTKSIIFTDDKE